MMHSDMSTYETIMLIINLINIIITILKYIKDQKK